MNDGAGVLVYRKVQEILGFQHYKGRSGCHCCEGGAGGEGTQGSVLHVYWGGVRSAWLEVGRYWGAERGECQVMMGIGEK